MPPRDDPEPAPTLRLYVVAELIRPGGDKITNRQEIPLTAWQLARHPGQLAEAAMNTCIAGIEEASRFLPPKKPV